MVRWTVYGASPICQTYRTDLNFCRVVFSQAADLASDPATNSIVGFWKLIKYESNVGTKDPPTTVKTLLEVLSNGVEIQMKSEFQTNGGEVRKSQSIYYLDARGETNKTGEFLTYKTKTRWKDNKLVSKGSIRSSRTLDYQEFTDEWELSPDGRLLTNITVFSTETYRNGRWDRSSAIPPKYIRVYERIK